MSLSSHVLDAVTGRPAVGLAVWLEARADRAPRGGAPDGGAPDGGASEGAGFYAGAWAELARRVTDADGRVTDLAAHLPAGIYRLRFGIEAYLGADAFYPEVAIAFRVTDPAEHVHVPLLLSPFAYSTYRGS